MNNVVSSNIHPEKGLRAQVLNKYLELASNYDTAVVFCGNIDLSLHPFKSCLTAESPVEVATSLYSFKHKFEIRNPYIYVKIIGALPRSDVERVVVQSTNTRLIESLSREYVSLWEIEIISRQC